MVTCTAAFISPPGFRSWTLAPARGRAGRGDGAWGSVPCARRERWGRTTLDYLLLELMARDRCLEAWRLAEQRALLRQASAAGTGAVPRLALPWLRRALAALHRPRPPRVRVFGTESERDRRGAEPPRGPSGRARPASPAATRARRDGKESAAHGHG